MKKVILESLAKLNQLTPSERITQRIEKFSSMGVVVENA
jgi:acetyl-CoA carboxylase carboxyl transferase subunit alpha